ncbi:MAG: tetratricopeptide repeat protein [Cyanobacteria bacterium J06639_14]
MFTLKTSKRWPFSGAATWLLFSGLTLLVTLPMGWHFSQIWDQEDAYDYPFALNTDGSGRRTLEQTIAFYEGRIQNNPTDGLDRASLAGAYLKMARATGDDRWYDLAEQTAQASLANLSFDNDGAVLVLARIAETNHDFAAAIRLAEQASGEEALAVLITSKLAIGAVEDAATIAHTLVDLSPSLGSFTLRALTRSARGDRAGALSDFQQAIAAEEPAETSGSAWTRTLLGRFYVQQGDHTLAEQLYQSALAIDADYPLALLQLAELKTQLGHYRAAERYYAQVDDPLSLLGMAHIQSLRGNTTAAHKLWQETEEILRQKIAANPLDHRQELAQLLLERGMAEDVSEAIALMQAEATNRQDAETLNLLARALSAADRWQEAQKIIREALDQGVQNAEIFYRAGTIEAALDNSSQATQYFQLAQTADPTFDPQAHPNQSAN